MDLSFLCILVFGLEWTYKFYNKFIKKIKKIIYYVVDITPIKFIITSIYKYFVIKLIVTLTFSNFLIVTS
jgi:hypothetical protein